MCMCMCMLLLLLLLFFFFFFLFFLLFLLFLLLLLLCLLLLCLLLLLFLLFLCFFVCVFLFLSRIREKLISHQTHPHLNTQIQLASITGLVVLTVWCFCWEIELRSLFFLLLSWLLLL